VQVAANERARGVALEREFGKRVVDVPQELGDASAGRDRDLLGDPLGLLAGGCALCPRSSSRSLRIEGERVGREPGGGVRRVQRSTAGGVYPVSEKVADFLLA
jgi:hypothetical protein